MKVGICLGNNQDNFQLHKFTRSENITKGFRGLLFDSHWIRRTTPPIAATMSRTGRRRHLRWTFVTGHEVHKLIGAALCKTCQVDPAPLTCAPTYQETNTIKSSATAEIARAHPWSLRRSRSFKVTDFYINRRPLCDFLLVNNTN